MLKFNTAANVTHSKYGTCKLDAVLETLLNITIIARISDQRMIISKNAANGDFSPKNSSDHNTLNTSCTKNMKIAGPTDLDLFCQTI